MLIDLGTTVRRLLALRSERGATATEYGLLVGFVAIAIVLGVGAFGGVLDAVYTQFASTLADALAR